MNIQELIAKYEPRFRKAFLAGVGEITSKARITEIVKALERGDTVAALALLYIQREAFIKYEAVFEAAFIAGGTGAIDNLGVLRDQNSNRFVFRFNARDIVAERWLRNYSTGFVTSIIDDQKFGIQRALERGLVSGQNPKVTALEIVGRINRRTGRREGGIIGLSSVQQDSVYNAHKELTEGKYTRYLTRIKRDKRFDSMVRRAQKENRPLTKVQIQKLTSRYSDRLLKLRGDTIALTETLTSLTVSKHISIDQLIATGNIKKSQITKEWDATLDDRTREDHVIADGQIVGWGEKYTVGGEKMKHPGDPSASAKQRIRCRCYEHIKIDYLEGFKL